MSHAPSPSRSGAGSPRTWLAVTLGGVAVFVAVHFAPQADARPALVPANTDAFHYHLPMRTHAFAAVREGTVPVWNPYILGGQPFLATHQHALLYPGNALHWILPPGIALGATMALHLAWAALGMFVWLGVRAHPPPARAIGAVAFALATCVVNPLQWPHVLLGNAWLPWVCAGIDTVATRPTPRRTALLALACSCLVLAGYMQGAVYIYYAAAPYAVFRWWQTRPADGGRRALALLCGLLVLPVMCTAVQTWPMLELSRYSARPPGGIDPRALMHLGHVPGAMIARSLLGRVDGTLAAVALAPPALVWLLAAAAPADRAARTHLVFWGAVGTVAAVLAAGFDTPLYRAYFALPTGNLFRLPVRLLVLSAGALAVFAATGATFLWQRASGPRTRRERLILGLVAIGVGIATIPASPLPGLCAVACVAAWYLMPAWRSALAGAAVCIVAWSATAAYSYDAYLPWHGASPFTDHADTAAFLRKNLGHDRAHIYRTTQEWKNWSYPANWGMTARVRQLTAYESLPSRHVAAAFDHMTFGRPSTSPTPFVGGLPLLPDAAHPEWLHLWSVRWIVVDRGVPRWPEHTDPTGPEWLQTRLGLTPVRVGDELLLHNPNALPRAYWVVRARSVPEESIWTILGRADFAPRDEVLIHGDARPAPPAGEPLPTGAVAFVTDEPTEIELHATSDGPGWVVLTDAWFPGWEATVDGKPARIYRANGVFRAISTPAGDHTIRFRYRPASVRWGAAISLAGLLALGACLLTTDRPRPPQEPAAQP